MAIYLPPDRRRKVSRSGEPSRENAWTYTPEEFEAARQKRFLARAILEGKLIHESE